MSSSESRLAFVQKRQQYVDAVRGALDAQVQHEHTALLLACDEVDRLQASVKRSTVLRRLARTNVVSVLLALQGAGLLASIVSEPAAFITHAVSGPVLGAALLARHLQDRSVALETGPVRVLAIAMTRNKEIDALEVLAIGVNTGTAALGRKDELDHGRHHRSIATVLSMVGLVGTAASDLEGSNVGTFISSGLTSMSIGYAGQAYVWLRNQHRFEDPFSTVDMQLERLGQAVEQRRRLFDTIEVDTALPVGIENHPDVTRTRHAVREVMADHIIAETKKAPPQRGFPEQLG